VAQGDGGAQGDGLENIPVPEAFPLEEEVADLGYVFIDASDGPEAAADSWPSGPAPDGRGELSARPIEATADAPILPRMRPLRETGRAQVRSGVGMRISVPSGR
jgi:hypothetical protein